MNNKRKVNWLQFKCKNCKGFMPYSGMNGKDALNEKLCDCPSPEVEFVYLTADIEL